MKTKTLGILIASLASVALMGAGFSTWVVSGTIDKANPANVSVTVGAVQDKRLTITAALKSDDNTLVFDCGGVEVAQPGPITVGDNSNTQDLSVTVDVTVTAAAGYPEKTPINIGWAVTLPENVKTNNLAVLSGVTYLDSSVKDAGKISITPTPGGNVQASLTFTFGWGSAFLGKNPAKIAANELTESVTLETILRDLGKLKSAMEVSSAVTININPIA